MSKKIWNKLFKSKSPKTLKSPAVSDNKKHKRFSIYEEYQQLNVTENQEKQLPKLKIHEIEKTPTEDELPCTATVAASMHNNAAPTKTQTTLSKVVNSLTLKRYSKDRSKDSSISLGNRNSNGSETSYKQMNAVNRQTATTQNNNNDNNTNNTHSSINNNIIDISEEPDSKISLKLIPCPICSRTFNPVTLQKHVKICEKMATKKRNVFDSSRQRREGTELASYPSPTNYNVPLVSHAQPPKLMQTPSPVLSRKKPIEELSRKSIRASVRKHSSLTPNAPQSAPTGTIITATPETSNAAVTSNFRRDRMRSSERSLSKRTQPPVAEQCPYCERCFGVKAYDRHVEWCKEKALQASIKLSTKNEQNVAKERLEARTKYRAPCLKTKRSINRDKYASLTGDENESTDSPKSGNSAYKNNNMSSNNIMSLSLTSSIMSETTTPHHGTSNAVHNSRNSSNHSNDNNKTCYFVEKTLPSRPNANKNEHQIRRSTEREVPDFRLNGESCETPSNKMKKDRLAFDQAADLNNVAMNESSAVGPRSLTRVGTSSFNNSQDNRVEIQTHIGNNLLGTSTPTNTSTAPSLLTKSLSSLSRRKLKAKEHSATNLSISKHGPTLDDVNSATVNSQIVNTKEPKIKKLHPSISLPHLEQQQEQQQESSIFGLTQNTKLKTTVSTTALSVHAKLETNPIKGPIICRPKRKKLQRQQNATSAPLKAIPLLKESIETFGLATKNKVILDKRKEINIIKAPGLTTNLNTAPTLLRNRSFILSGHLDAYDPFLSAKRQLEDLCSPSTANSPKRTFNSYPQTPLTPNTPKKPLTPCTTQANRMTSSLMTSSHDSSVIQNSQGLLSSLAPKSNFRRTSSLRGPRRSPMLSPRPIFTQKHRPSIQRGLSDEGPISTNFLKPEEYDEMPVRAVCVNDFALSNSPRVLRRDTISSNRKHNLKLNVSAANSSQISPNINPEVTSKCVSKTDSLAVFLKYENELEKSPITAVPSIISESPVITKELKEKSNTLNKQNSAKNIIAEAQEHLRRTAEPQNSPNWSPDQLENQHFVDKPSNSFQSNNENCSSNYKLSQATFEPNTKVDVKQVYQKSKPTIPLNKQATPIVSTKSVIHTPTVESAKPPIRLTSIFDDSRSKKTNMNDSTNEEFIDPKLINKYDNLPVNVTSGRTLKHSNEKFSTHSSEYSPTSSECSKDQAEGSNLSKQPSQHSKVEAQDTAAFSKQNTVLMPRNVSEGRNLLKRKMRLGRNQFLYDKSPEIDSCSADDEANRSSVEYDDKNFPTTNLRLNHFSQHQPNISHVTAPPTIPPLSMFDDFDFEEFLLSFQNDDDQFPLFKDCREFLMNRTSNKHRSTGTATSEFIRDNTNIHTNAHEHRPEQLTTYNPTTLPQFPFQSFNNQHYTDSPLNASSYRTKSPLESLEYNHNETFTNYDEPKSAHSRPDFDFDEVDKKKREIFISIETEQNDQGRSTISPDSLRSIVGDNQNPHVEEVPANDNKFSKIEDDDDRMPISSTSRSYFEANQLPNIQLNNAKNLIQKMQDSFRQMGEEAGTSIRQAVLNSTPRSSTASNSFFDNIRSPLSTERSEVAENVGSPVDGDSDEASSLESYPVSSQSSRRGVASKLSADSAYGSLSRQRSSEFANLNRQIRSRPSTSSCGTNTALVTPMIDAATQHQPQKLQQKPQNIKNTTKRSLSRQFSANSSTSGSDISLPPLVEKMSDHLSKNLQDHQGMSGYEQKSQQQIYDNTSNDYTYHNKSLIQPTAPIKTDTTSTIGEGTSQAVRTSLSRLTPASCSSNSINSSSMTSSMKISRFCHECGSRFLIDEAKFCMDCGVKRLIL